MRRVTYVIYLGAALAEIAGCFAFWVWLRLDKSALWIVPGIGSLCLFAYLLTLVDAEYAGRTYAAYGGIYIASALLRSEEHTSELQSLMRISYAVFCLKKKKHRYNTRPIQLL